MALPSLTRMEADELLRSQARPGPGTQQALSIPTHWVGFYRKAHGLFLECVVCWLFLKNTAVFLRNESWLNVRFLGQTLCPGFVVLLLGPWH